jgi:hypothetical protein
VAALAPFDMQTLEHFIFLERPLAAPVADSPSFAPARTYVRPAWRDHLMPSAQDYSTVGDLYRAIRGGLAHLAAALGEKELFCGDEMAQLGPPDISLPGLAAIADLRAAGRALDTIVRQGEGSEAHVVGSHYARFAAIRDEYAALLERRAEFAPARPAARNPVMRAPPDAAGKVWVTHPAAVPVLDLANALYSYMLRLLAQACGRPRGYTVDRKLLIDAAIDVMQALTPVAVHLTHIPASESVPGVNAGLTFAMLRNVIPLAVGPGEWRVLGERARELAQGAQALAGKGELFAVCGRALSGVATRLIHRAEAA